MIFRCGRAVVLLTVGAAAIGVMASAHAQEEDPPTEPAKPAEPATDADASKRVMLFVPEDGSFRESNEQFADALRLELSPHGYSVVSNTLAEGTESNLAAASSVQRQTAEAGAAAGVWLQRGADGVRVRVVEPHGVQLREAVLAPPVEGDESLSRYAAVAASTLLEGVLVEVTSNVQSSEVTPEQEKAFVPSRRRPESADGELDDDTGNAYATETQSSTANEKKKEIQPILRAGALAGLINRLREFAPSDSRFGVGARVSAGAEWPFGMRMALAVDILQVVPRLPRIRLAAQGSYVLPFGSRKQFKFAAGGSVGLVFAKDEVYGNSLDGVVRREPEEPEYEAVLPRMQLGVPLELSYQLNGSRNRGLYLTVEPTFTLRPGALRVVGSVRSGVLVSVGAGWT